MTELHMIYVASIVGAALFFVAGAATVALRRRAPVAAPAVDRAHDAELVQLRATARAYGTELAASRAAIGQGEARAVQLTRELAAARAATRSAEQAAVTATERAVHAQAQVQRLGGELDRTRGEALGVQGDAASLRTRIGELERLLAERIRIARDLSTENEQLKGRLRDADALRSEYVRLRTAATDVEYLKSEVERLEGELRAMHVEALSPGRPRAARGSVQPRTSSIRTIGESLATAIDRFADDGTRSIAVADTMGFPLASNGADGVALAAYAALLIESAGRARQFLPVAAPAGIEVVDDHGTRVSVWTFEVDGDRLLLANLAVTPVDSRRVEATLADLGAILAPTQLRTHTG